MDSQPIVGCIQPGKLQLRVTNHTQLPEAIYLLSVLYGARVPFCDLSHDDIPFPFLMSFDL